MADLQIRNVDQEALRRIDASAERQGLSRNGSCNGSPHPGRKRAVGRKRHPAAPESPA